MKKGQSCGGLLPIGPNPTVVRTTSKVIGKAKKTVQVRCPHCKGPHSVPWADGWEVGDAYRCAATGGRLVVVRPKTDSCL